MMSRDLRNDGTLHLHKKEKLLKMLFTAKSNFEHTKKRKQKKFTQHESGQSTWYLEAECNDTQLRVQTVAVLADYKRTCFPTRPECNATMALYAV